MATAVRLKTKTDKTSRPTGNPVSQLELVELLHKRAVNEVIIVEVDPGRFQMQPIVAWRFGRSVLIGSSGQPRTFRSLETLITHLKTLGIGRTLVRLELLD
ncbi:hypothetical protein QTH97_23995 [Variovorax sp. J22R24]|uniref:hypothetical protein n=1 Tax=Variovorax gracilis TaxID=3053502 RepID=UPI0025749951|nr:hypothetical protein [Variovorax sp. J22R24]MDM0108032.1 hypothetical protein [Variovorax sp. J22R24]